MTVFVVMLIGVGFVLGFATAAIVREASDLYGWSAARRRDWSIQTPEQPPVLTRATAAYAKVSNKS